MQQNGDLRTIPLENPERGGIETKNKNGGGWSAMKIKNINGGDCEKICVGGQEKN